MIIKSGMEFIEQRKGAGPFAILSKKRFGNVWKWKTSNTTYISEARLKNKKQYRAYGDHCRYSCGVEK